MTIIFVQSVFNPWPDEKYLMLRTNPANSILNPTLSEPVNSELVYARELIGTSNISEPKLGGFIPECSLDA